jgi:hypothetical protein
MSDQNEEINSQTNEIRYDYFLRQRSEVLFDMCDTQTSRRLGHGEDSSPSPSTQPMKNCTIDELGDMIVDNFQMLFDLIDLDGNGYVNFDDFVCDKDNRGGCDVYELEMFLNAAGFPSELNGFVAPIFDLMDSNSDRELKIEDLNDLNRNLDPYRRSSKISTYRDMDEE